MIETVCVIGAGPGGLVAVKELVDAGLEEVVAFDRASELGGRWSLGYPAGVWKELTLNINRRFMEFSDFPWKPDHYASSCKEAHHGIYAHNTEARDYLQDYARHFHLESKIQLETEVLDVSHQSDKGGVWNVLTEHKGKKESRTFDAVVVCSGYQAVARTPEHLQNMLKDFTGTTIHSQQFSTVNGYEGQRVLVYAAGVSGADIASELARNGNCQLVVNSVRNSPYHVHEISSKTREFFDDILFQRLPVWLMNNLPEAVSCMGFKQVVLDNWPDQPTGIHKPDADIRSAGACPGRYYMETVKSGKIILQEDVASIDGRTVTFQGGPRKDFDTIIVCTGYDFDLSFLHVQDQLTFSNPTNGKKELGLYKMTLAPGISTLAFCGMVNTYGAHFSTAEMQARLIAGTFSGKIPRPSEAALRMGVEKVKAKRTSCKLNAGDLSNQLCEDIGEDLGVTPGVGTALWNAKKLLLSPMYPCYYRTNPGVDGEARATQALNRFEEYMANPQIAKEQ